MNLHALHDLLDVGHREADRGFDAISRRRSLGGCILRVLHLCVGKLRPCSVRIRDRHKCEAKRDQKSRYEREP